MPSLQYVIHALRAGRPENIRKTVSEELNFKLKFLSGFQVLGEVLCTTGNVENVDI